MPCALSSMSIVQQRELLRRIAPRHARPGAARTATPVRASRRRDDRAHRAAVRPAPPSHRAPRACAAPAVGTSVDAAEVREVHAGRIERQQALDRGALGLRLELHRHGVGKHPGAIGGVELAVRRAEGVAGEPAARERRPRCSGDGARGRACRSGAARGRRRAPGPCRRGSGARALHRPPPIGRRSGPSPRRRTPPARPAYNAVGSIMWRAPRGCTSIVARRQLAASAGPRRRRGRGARGSG